jgi:hypothetical protein
MENLLTNFNLLPVLISSAVSFIIGAIWFGPNTLYPVWMKALGREIPKERVKMSTGETLLMFGGTYIAALIQVATLGLIIAMARTIDANLSAGTGALFGFVFSVGLGAFASLSHRMFSQPDFKVYRSLKVWLIEVGQDVVCLTIAGAIIGAWV